MRPPAGSTLSGTTAPLTATGVPPLQRAVALSVIVLPALGTGWALVIAARQGVRGVELGLFVGFAFLTFFGITAGFHRHLAHRAFRTSRGVRWVLLVLANMAAQGPPLFWVATHRRHHATSDRPGDPHSPWVSGSRVRGLFYAHLGWMVLHPGGDITVHARDLLRDRQVFALNQQYFFWLFLGMALPAALGWASTGTAAGALGGFLWGGAVRMFVVNQLSWAVGSFGHMFGRRDYETRDHSTNIPWLAPFTLGEAYHNNHHAFPSSAATGLEWWQIDPAGWILRLLGALGIVWDLKIPSPTARAAARARGYEATELGSSETSPDDEARGA